MPARVPAAIEKTVRKRSARPLGAFARNGAAEGRLFSLLIITPAQTRDHDSYSAWASLRFASEGRELGFEMLHLVFDGVALARQEIRHRPRETGIAYPMRAVGRCRHVAALDLVLALRARLDALQAMRDGEVDRAVVASLEMQEGEIAQTSPVAAIKRIAAEEIERAGDVAAALACHHQHHALGKARAEEVEEAPRQIGRAPFAIGGRAIEAKKRIPMPGLDGFAGERLDLDPAGQRVPPLAPDLLALARGKRGKKLLEIRVAIILPMELPPDALQETGRAEALPFGFGGKGDMERGDFMPARKLDHGADERVRRRRVGVRTQQQATPGHRRERHRALELRIIFAARPLIGRSPAPVEDIFAVGVALEVERCHAQEMSCSILDREMLGQPSRFRRRRARGLERL